MLYCLFLLQFCECPSLKTMNAVHHTYKGFLDLHVEGKTTVKIFLLFKKLKGYTLNSFLTHKKLNILCTYYVPCRSLKVMVPGCCSGV